MSGGKLRIYFSGIGGSGVSAIAGLMRDKGHTVAGSDRAFDTNPFHPAYQALKEKGVSIIPQDGSGLDESFDFMVMSTAVEEDRPEVLKARVVGVPIKTRPEYLAELVSMFETIAVSGTSGKSTASGMLAYVMRQLGLSPNFLGGGRVKAFRTASNPGNSLAGDSGILIVEACESDGTIVRYRPRHCMLLNLSLDHHSIEKTAGMFRTLLANTSGLKVVNADDENLGALIPTEAVTFSMRKPSKYRASEIAIDGLRSSFTVNGTRYSLSLPGRHNIYNALSCIAVLSEMGVPPDDMARVLPGFNGIERRFDIHLSGEGKLVVDDYAHNPHKIGSLMETIKGMGERVCYVFQPHGYGPTRLMKDEYIRVFSGYLRDTDLLMVLPIFYAGGTAEKDISSEVLAEGIRTNGKPARAVPSREEVIDKIKGWDTCVVFGARDETLSGLAKSIAQSLK